LSGPGLRGRRRQTLTRMLSEQAQIYGTLNRIRAGGHSQLLVDGLQVGLDCVARDVKSGGHLHVTGGRQQCQNPQLRGAQWRDEDATGSFRLRGADVQGRTDEPVQERLWLHLRRMLDQVPRHLGHGRDDRVDETSTACCPEHIANDASGRGVAALDRSGSQEYLAHQCCARRQVPQRPGVQVHHSGLVIVRGERDPGQQQAAGGSGQPTGELDRGARVAE
jgi:hypothetical protein